MADYSENKTINALDAVSSPLTSGTRVLCQDPGDTDKIVYTTPGDIASAVYGTDDNAFTDAEQSKLTNIEAGATGDQTGVEIKALYEAEPDTNPFTDLEQTKLFGIEASADVTDASNVASAGALMSSNNLSEVSNPAAARTNLGLGDAGFSEADQNALWAGLQAALDGVGVLAKEIDAQRFTRHQQGTITLYNRGVKSGCALTKSGTATRNVNIASGVVFRSGRTWGVDEQINGASVQNNNTAESATCQVYLDSDMDMLVTDLGVTAPDDGLVLAIITVPAGSNNSTDPNLASCTITPVARQEPEWPGIQLSESYEDVSFDRVMSGAGYQVSLDPVSWEGGERPVLVTEESERATNAFRVTLGGMADTVKINYMARLMAM